jgi:RecA/RadA recombinase/DNA-binding transcriptional ArsR family regulator
MITGANLREAFLDYRERLGPTILVSASKSPLHKLKPLPSEAELLALLPRAHGIALRMWPESPLICLDFDGPHAQAAWDATGIVLPETARTRTKSGGRHLFFRVPEGTPSPRECGDGDGRRRKVRLVKAACGCRKPCGVDLLLNGYAVVPPTPGYAEDPDHPLELARMAVLPQPVIALAKGTEQRAEKPAEQDWFREAILGPIADGQRNETANKVAFDLFKSGVPRHRVTAILEAWAAAACVPPLTRDGKEMRKLRGTIQSAETAAKRERAKGAAKGQEDSPTLLAVCSAVDVLRRTKAEGDPIPTGIKALDERLRGGMRTRRTMMIAGTAGHGKTSLALQVARAAAEAGVITLCRFVDEGDEPACIRLGQSFGWKREQVEDRLDPLLAKMEAQLAGKPLFLVDPDTLNEPTIESAADTLWALMQERHGALGLLILDSIQRVHTRTSGEACSERERVTDNGQTARRMAVEKGIAVVFTSEMNRAAYKSKREEDRSVDLASPAEARLEYWCDVHLTMRVPSEEDPYTVKVTLPKNRLGSKAPLWFHLDPDRASFTAVEGDPRAKARAAAESQKADAMREEILRQLQATPGLTRTALREAVGGNKGLFDETLKELRGSGIVEARSGGNRNRIEHYLAEIPNRDQPGSTGTNTGTSTHT